MDFTNNFLTEFRKTIKEILLEGDLERLNLAKQFLGFDNKAFGEFLAPLFKEDSLLTLHHTTQHLTKRQIPTLLRYLQKTISSCLRVKRHKNLWLAYM